MTSLTIAFSVGLLFYTLGLNNPQASLTYSWQQQTISPSPPPDSHYSLSTFFFPKGSNSFVVVYNTSGVQVDIKEFIIGDTSVFMSYNWTGGNWTLYFGIQVDNLTNHSEIKPSRRCRFARRSKISLAEAKKCQPL